MPQAERDQVYEEESRQQHSDRLHTVLHVPEQQVESRAAFCGWFSCLLVCFCRWMGLGKRIIFPDLGIFYGFLNPKQKTSTSQIVLNKSEGRVMAACHMVPPSASLSRNKACLHVRPKVQSAAASPTLPVQLQRRG